MKIPTDFDLVIEIPKGHIRHGLYYCKLTESPKSFYWILHESPYAKVPGEIMTEDEIPELKGRVAIKIDEPSQLRAIGSKMLRAADSMEAFLELMRKAVK